MMEPHEEERSSSSTSSSSSSSSSSDSSSSSSFSSSSSWLLRTHFSRSLYYGSACVSTPKNLLLNPGPDIFLDPKYYVIDWHIHHHDHDDATNSFTYKKLFHEHDHDQFSMVPSLPSIHPISTASASPIISYNHHHHKDHRLFNPSDSLVRSESDRKLLDDSANDPSSNVVARKVRLGPESDVIIILEKDSWVNPNPDPDPESQEYDSSSMDANMAASTDVLEDSPLSMSKEANPGGSMEILEDSPEPDPRPSGSMDINPDLHEAFPVNLQEDSPENPEGPMDGIDHKDSTDHGTASSDTRQNSGSSMNLDEASHALVEAESESSPIHQDSPSNPQNHALVEAESESSPIHQDSPSNPQNHALVEAESESSPIHQDSPSNPQNHALVEAESESSPIHQDSPSNPQNHALVEAESPLGYSKDHGSHFHFMRAVRHSFNSLTSPGSNPSQYRLSMHGETIALREEDAHAHVVAMPRSRSYNNLSDYKHHQYTDHHNHNHNHHHHLHHHHHHHHHLHAEHKTIRAVLASERFMVDLRQLLLGERFASGTYSKIYHGIYKGEPVAVKIIRMTEHPDHRGGGEEEERDDVIVARRLDHLFNQEVSMLSHLEHPNVIKLLAASKKPPVLCVITEYLSGGSVRAFLGKRQGNSVSMERVLEMALNVAHGMEYLHKEGIAHRDLKSENLVMDGHGTVKIVDFGVSCFETECGSNSYDHDGGTYRWMAPEMLRHLPHSRKVDVYSFGIVLWELLTTRLPYEDVNPIQAAFCVVNQSRPPIPSDCPNVLADLMSRCWSLDPETRPEFSEIVRSLTEFQESLLALPSQ